MKKYLHIASALVILAVASSFTMLMDCGSFEPFVKGTQYTTTSYDGTGKPLSSVQSTVREVKVDGGKTVATIDVISSDGQGKATDTSFFDLICDGTSFRMDLRALASQQASAMGGGAEISIEADMLDYPIGMTVGQSLPGGEVKLTMKTKGSPLPAVTTMQIKDRKCVAIEKKTTPAGTWECYKITSIQEGSTQMAGMSFPVAPRESTEWFSFKVGSVRNETRSGGKLEGYSELTKFTKPQ